MPDRVQAGAGGSRKRFCVFNGGHPVIEHVLLVHATGDSARRTYCLPDVQLRHGDFRVIPISEGDREINQVEVYAVINGAVKKPDHPMTAAWRPFAPFVDVWVKLDTDGMRWAFSLDARSAQDAGRLVDA